MTLESSEPASSDTQLDLTNIKQHGYVPEWICDELAHLDLSNRVLKVPWKLGGGVTGRGTFGDVFKGHLQCSNEFKVVAIKQMRFYLPQDIRTVFEKEIYAWSKANHNNILPLLGFAIDASTGYPLLVSEWMKNGTVEQYVRRNSRCDFIRLIKGIVDGLAYMHTHVKSMMHLDIKPDNILVSDTGDALICDFGSARMLAASKSIAKPSEIQKGTVHYLAPEILKQGGASRFSGEADVWAFGMTVFELLSGQIPYQDIHESVIPTVVMSGQLPTLPSSLLIKDSEIVGFLWQICLRCWECNLMKRIRMVDVSAEFEGFQLGRDKHLDRSLDDAEYHPHILTIETLKGGDELASKNHPKANSYGSVHLISARILAQLGHLDLSKRRVVVEIDGNPRGYGGFSDVYQGQCVFPNLGKLKVAVKRLRVALMRNTEMLLDFEKEIYIWSKLKHPNILPLIGYFHDEETGYPQLVSEWMDNGSALRYIKANPDCYLMRLITGTAKGLAYLHDRGAIHSDVKPDNILVSRFDDALICDFGITRMINASLSLVKPSEGGALKGTTRYMAYELIESNTPHSTSSDVWAFGMTVYTLMTLRVPYYQINNDPQIFMVISRGETPSFPDSFSVSDSEVELLRSICQRCWDMNPQTRIRMAEIKSILSELQDESIDIIPQLLEELKLGASNSVFEEVITEVEYTQRTTSYRLLVWHALSGELLNSSPHGHESAISSLVFSPDRSRIASGTVDGIVQIWNAQTAEPIGKSLKMHARTIMSIAFAHDNGHVVSGSEDKTVKIWNTATMPPLAKVLRGHTESVSCIVVATDALRVASDSTDRTIRLWECKTGKTIGESLRGHARSVSCITFSRDGALMASGSDDGMIKLWDASNGTSVGDFTGHDDIISSIAFSPDDRSIVSCSFDWSIRTWDTESRKTSGEPMFGHQDAVLSVAFSADGDHVISASKDKTFMKWNATTTTLASRPKKAYDLHAPPIAISFDGRYAVSSSYIVDE